MFLRYSILRKVIYSGAQDGFKNRKLPSGLPSLSDNPLKPMGRGDKKKKPQNDEKAEQLWRTEYKVYCETQWDVKKGLENYYEREWEDVPEKAYGKNAYVKMPFVPTLKWDFNKDSERKPLFKNAYLYGRLNPNFFKRNENQKNEKRVFSKFGFIEEVKNENNENVPAKKSVKNFISKSRKEYLKSRRCRRER